MSRTMAEAPVGHVKASVGVPAPADEKVSNVMMKKMGGMMKKGQEIAGRAPEQASGGPTMKIPDKYGSSDGSGLSYDLK